MRPELTRWARSAASEAALRPGFTLLEVLLALLLASMLLIVLTTAVDFQLRAVDVSRTDVEEAQLARVLLHRIANDLRNAVRYRPINYDELISSSSGSSEPAGGEESTGEATGETGETGESEGLFAEDSGSENAEDSGSAAETDAEEGETEAAPGVPQSMPGIYGGPDWIQIDVCHLPRLEQIESLLAPTEELTQTCGIGNVKTVDYYVISADEATYAADGTEPGGGLVRRESDRAASLLAAEIGGLEETDIPPIASEVLAIEFLYSNGSEWVDSWDTTESGGLPVAVEVSIVIRRVRSRKEQLALREGAAYQASVEEEPSLIYRQIIHLPAAEPTSSEASGGTSEATFGGG